MLACWLEAAGVAPAVVVANSMGCQVAAHLAARRPERVRALVLQGLTIDAATRTAPRQAARLACDGRWERASLGLLQVRGLRQMGLSRFTATLRAALEDRIEDKVEAVGCPVLVVRGSRDVVMSQRWAQTVTQRAPRGQLRVVPGAGHCIVYSAPLELSRLVMGFAATLPDGVSVGCSRPPAGPAARPA